MQTEEKADEPCVKKDCDCKGCSKARNFVGSCCNFCNSNRNSNSTLNCCNSTRKCDSLARKNARLASSRGTRFSSSKTRSAAVSICVSICDIRFDTASIRSGCLVGIKNVSVDSIRPAAEAATSVRGRPRNCTWHAITTKK